MLQTKTTRPARKILDGLTEAASVSDRVMRLSPPIRSHYGPIFVGEPSILFRTDGSVRVTVGDHVAELTADEADGFGRPYGTARNAN